MSKLSCHLFSSSFSKMASPLHSVLLELETHSDLCTRNVLNYFFKIGDLSMVQLTQKMQFFLKKVKNKRQKCIDITLRKWSWRPLWQVGKNILTPPQATRWTFLKSLEFFHNSQTCWELWKNHKTLKKLNWWPVETSTCFLPTCHKGLHDHLRSVMSMHFWRSFHFFDFFCIFWVNWTIERSSVLKK